MAWQWLLDSRWRLRLCQLPLASEAIRLSKDPRSDMQAIYDVGSHYAIWMNVAAAADNKLVSKR